MLRLSFKENIYQTVYKFHSKKVIDVSMGYDAFSTPFRELKIL